MTNENNFIPEACQIVQLFEIVSYELEDCLNEKL